MGTLVVKKDWRYGSRTRAPGKLSKPFKAWMMVIKGGNSIFQAVVGVVPATRDKALWEAVVNERGKGADDGLAPTELDIRPH
ncbi:MAG: hypothetical protein C5B49_16515 [Bdellovibrio sp.]|nr:MAG: hypothetical protein C5B49_16515 [Bdellovibrio sp.]